MRKCFLLALLLLGISLPSQATLVASDIISRARTYLKDQATNANRQYFTDAVLLGFLNDGQREANSINWVLQSSMSITLVGGTTEYAMPADFISTQRVWFKPTSGTFGKLEASSMDKLDADNGNWTSASGLPTKYYIDRTTSTAVYLGFYPAPTTTSTGTATVYYTQNMPDVSVTTGQPFAGWNNLQPYTSALAYYIAYRGYMVLEEKDLAVVYYNEWLQLLQVMRQGMNRQPDFNPPAAGLRGP